VHKICVGLAAALLLAASVSAPGEPSLIGYTGLLPAPTADTLGDPQYNIAIASTEAQNWEDRAYLANFGLQPGLEAGVQWWHPENGGRRHCLTSNIASSPPRPVAPVWLWVSATSKSYTTGSKPATGTGNSGNRSHYATYHKNCKEKSFYEKQSSRRAEESAAQRQL